MAEHEKIIHTLDDTGTPNGQSGILQLANKCPMRWYLQNRHGQTPVLSDKNLSIGKFLHAYMELYYDRAMKGLSTDYPVEAVEFSNIAKQSTQQQWNEEAARLFKAYRQRYKLGTEGTPVSVERLMPAGTIRQDHCGHTIFTPEDEAQAKRVAEAVGYPDYTARADLETYISPEEVRYVRLSRQIGRLKEPGNYLWDYKTTAFIRKVSLEQYRDSLQFTYYHTARNAMLPDEPVKGTIVVVIVKTKQPDFFHLLIPTPSQKAIDRMHRASERAIKEREKSEKRGWYYANTSCCYDFNKDCEWRESGVCER